MKTYAVQYYHDREMIIEIIGSRSVTSAELQIIREKGSYNKKLRPCEFRRAFKKIKSI